MTRLAAFLVAAATAAAFWPVLHNGFVNFDDGEMILENPLIRGLDGTHLKAMSTSFYMTTYQPLAWFFYALMHRFFAFAPQAYHALNLALHTANAALLFLVAVKYVAGNEKPDSGTVWLAAAASLVWALHPLRVESVAWASETANLLAPFLCLLSLLCYMDGRFRASLILFVLGALCRWRAVFLPLALLLFPGRSLKRILPFAVISLALSWINSRSKSLTPGADFLSFLLHPGLTASALIFYVKKSVWPTGLIALHHAADLTSPHRLALAALIAAGAALFSARRLWPQGAGAALFFCAALAPTFALSRDGVIYAHDSYTYIPSMAVAPALAALAGKSRHAGALALVLVCAAFAWKTRAQIPVWRDSETLWTHALKVDPNCWVAHQNLAVALVEQGRLDEAADHFERLRALAPMDAGASAALEQAVTHLRSRQGLPDSVKKALGHAGK